MEIVQLMQIRFNQTFLLVLDVLELGAKLFNQALNSRILRTKKKIIIICVNVKWRLTLNNKQIHYLKPSDDQQLESKITM